MMFCGVSPARRNVLKPASVNASRERVSPACAPSPGPPSLIEQGMQINVEAP